MANLFGTKNVYYEARNFNDTTQPIQASIDSALIYPLLRDAGSYAVGLAKATIPLQLVPLRKDNIPLKTYQVGLKQGSYSGSAYVRQLNGSTTNFFFSQLGLTINKYTYKSTGAPVLVGSFDVSSFMNYLFDFLVDDYLNFYCVGSNSNAVYGDTLYIISSTSILLNTLEATNINSIYINGIQTLFIADTTSSGGIVNVYSNLNSATSVQLSLLATITTDFATNILQNIVFVVATLDTIIIGHDTNILTYYNMQYAAITDYAISNVVQMTAANVLNGNGTLIVADSNAKADLLFGTRSNTLFNIETDLQETSDISIIGNAAILSSIPVAFYSGVDTTTYYSTWPIASPPEALTQVNNTTLLSSIASNKNGVYGITTTNSLVCFNLNLVGNNDWFQFVDSLEINSGSILSFDWNPSTDYIVAVSSNNDLYQSNTPVYPINLGYIYNGALSINGGSNNSFANNTINTINLKSNAITGCAGFAVALDGSYYCIEGVAGSQVVNKRSQLDYSLGVLATYTLVETAGNMNLICIVGGYLVVADSIVGNSIYIYTLGTSTLVKSISIAEIAAICSVNDNDVLAVAYNDAGAFINVYDILTVPPLSVYQITDVQFPVLLSITANKLDLSGTNSAIFYSVNYNNNPAGQLTQLTYTGNYATASATVIKEGTSFAGFTNLTCNAITGLLYFQQAIVGVSAVQTYATNQASGYTTLINIKNLPTTLVNQLVVSPNLNGVIDWTAITSNAQAKNVSISRNNVNLLYIVEDSSSTIYQGTIADNTVVFSQIVEFASQTYEGIANFPNNVGVIDSTIRTFTISNQTLINTIDIPNQTVNSIAKNEIKLLGEFLIPSSNSTKITSYSFDLNTNYNLTLATSGALFAKNGEDIDAGALDIFSFSVLIAGINVAFQEAYTRLQVNNPTPLTEAPTISLDYTTGLCTLSYSADYTTSTNNGILFNNALTQLITFNPYLPSATLAGFYKIILPLNSTSYIQTAKSIFQFNLLDKIGIQSNTIFVSDSYFGNNQTNRIISTIDVPTTDFLENTGQILYFQPNFMRPYTLSSSNAIDRVQIDILYQYRDFTTYNLLLAPASNFSCLLDFVRLF